MSKLMTTTAALILAATPLLAETGTSADATVKLTAEEPTLTEQIATAAENAETAIGEHVSEFGQKMQAWTKPEVDVEGYLPMVAGTISAETLYGAPVIDAIAASTTDNTDKIGEVSDLILNEDGKVTQAVISVGGFLGIGATDVTVTVDEVQIMRAMDDPDDVIVVVDAKAVETRAELQG